MAHSLLNEHKSAVVYCIHIDVLLLNGLHRLRLNLRLMVDRLRPMKSVIIGLIDAQLK